MLREFRSKVGRKFQSCCWQWYQKTYNYRQIQANAVSL